MLKYLAKRIIYLIPILFGVIFILFVLNEISPGDPAQMILGVEATEEQIMELREELQLDDPFLTRFFRYVLHSFTGDLGTSYRSGQPVLKELMVRFPVSLIFAVGAVLLGVLFGVPLGIISAIKQYTWIDSALIVFSMALLAIPGFCLALFGILLFSVKWGVLPTSGIADWKGYILPMAVIMLSCMSTNIRMTRTTMLDVMRQEYVKTARAKGQKERIVIFRHMVRNTLIPMVSQIGFDFGNQLGGALIIETVFGVPGVGKYIADAITSRNYPSALGGVFVLACVCTAINLILDIIYAYVDPRLKTSLILDNVKKRRKKVRGA